MKAIVWTAYGGPDVLKLREVETPEPGANEVRVRIRATSVTAGDVEMRTLKLPLGLGLPMRVYNGLFKPSRLTILGQEFAGDIEAVGEGVTKFEVGQAVFGVPGFTLGCYAEYRCLSPDDSEVVIAPKPDNMSYQEAAAVPFGGMEALHFLWEAKIRPGEHVLINGAGGSIGTFGVQLAKHMEAEVSAVDSEDKLDMLGDLGADHVIDYAEQDFSQLGESYDVIFDVIGKSPFEESMRVLKPGGRYVLANPRLGHLLRGAIGSKEEGKRMIAGSAKRTSERLLFLKEMIEGGDLRTVIDRTYPLERMAEAHRYVETGRKQGNLVVTI